MNDFVQMLFLVTFQVTLVLKAAYRAVMSRDECLVTEASEECFAVKVPGERLKETRKKIDPPDESQQFPSVYSSFCECYCACGNDPFMFLIHVPLAVQIDRNEKVFQNK